ncbi:hypothetical protein Tco_0728124 [Tanacetum coccineum]|uniref:Uncharacterized protein n=1 Tax=Tanacetum coccineum TaxID=301880 RepID=A0ABQ4YNB3_9ASTR
MTNNINHLRELVDQAWVKHSKDHFRAPTAKDMEILIKTCLMPLALKTQNDSFAFVHELKKEMHADLKYVESLENEIDELESDKAEFSNMYDNSPYAHAELQCLYDHKVKECECLAQKLSKQTESWIPIRKSVETYYNANDSASPLGKKKHNPNTTICANSSSLSAGTSMVSEPISSKGSSNVNMRDLCVSLRISLNKKRRFVAELEALREQGYVARPLEHMREIVARDSVTLRDLEQLLARAQVEAGLKAGYVADMEAKE